MWRRFFGALLGSANLAAVVSSSNIQPVAVPKISLPPPPRATKSYRSHGKRYPMNGDRERARRRRQIAAGSLKPENGLRL